MLYLLFIIFLFTVIFIFSSKKLSPIPYFPSQPIDLPLIIKALNLKNNQTIIDLGAGDGLVIFQAAKTAHQKKLSTQFVAVEINPILVFILYVRWLFHPNRKNIKIIYGDIFKLNFMNFTNFINFKNFITLYLYISPWYIKKTLLNIQKYLKTFTVVSYMYPIPKMPKYKKIHKTIQGKYKIYIQGTV